MTTFNYHIRNSVLTYLIRLFSSIALVFIPITCPQGIPIGAFRLVIPVPVAFLLIVCGLVILFRLGYQSSQIRLLSARRNLICINSDTITYPQISGYTIQIKTFRLSDITHITYYKKNGKLTVRLSNGEQITFARTFFDNAQKIDEFASLLQQTSANGQ